MSQTPNLALAPRVTLYRPKTFHDYPEYHAWVAAGNLDELAQKYNLKVEDFTDKSHLLPAQAAIAFTDACCRIPGIEEAMEADGWTLECTRLPWKGVDPHRVDEINDESAWAVMRAAGCEGGDSSDAEELGGGSSDPEESYMDEEMQVQEEEEEGPSWVIGDRRGHTKRERSEHEDFECFETNSPDSKHSPIHVRPKRS